MLQEVTLCREILSPLIVYSDIRLWVDIKILNTYLSTKYLPI